MLEKMKEPVSKESTQQKENLNNSVYHRSIEAESVILPGQPFIFQDRSEPVMQMQAKDGVIQMISAAQQNKLDKAILAHQANPSVMTASNLEKIINQISSPDSTPGILCENLISRSFVYEWVIGGYIFRGHVHYEELEYDKKFIRNEEGPIRGHAWIKGVDNFAFLLPAYVMEIEKNNWKMEMEKRFSLEFEEEPIKKRRMGTKKKKKRKQGRKNKFSEREIGRREKEQEEIQMEMRREMEIQMEMDYIASEEDELL